MLPTQYATVRFSDVVISAESRYHEYLSHLPVLVAGRLVLTAAFLSYFMDFIKGRLILAILLIDDCHKN